MEIDLENDLKKNNIDHKNSEENNSNSYLMTTDLSTSDFYHNINNMNRLNNANIKDTNLIVVLNDNQMSIAQSVGGLSTYLSKIRSNTFYNTSKRDIKEMLKKFPLLGKPIHKIMHEIKKRRSHTE